MKSFEGLGPADMGFRVSLAGSEQVVWHLSSLHRAS